MAIFKRGKIYWYHFYFNGQHIQESTKQGNPRVARNMESAHRTSLAKGEVGLRERKPVPTLHQFITNEFLPWAEATFRAKHKTFLWYRGGSRRLKEFEPLATTTLDQITGAQIATYIAHRQADELNITAINRELQILRRILRLAVEWGHVPQTAKIKMLPGETRRERVITPNEEARYLAAAAEPLASIATVLIDSGMRPEECFRLGWESVTWVNGRYGTLLVTHGKIAAARRVLPMTPRVRNILEAHWKTAGKPLEGWIWPAPTRSGHVEPSSIRKHHAKTFEIVAEEAAKNNLKPVRPFVLYTLRHTFLTRLGESGCDVWTLARIAGHSTIGISARYVHPSEDAVLAAITKLSGAAPARIEATEPEARPMLPS
jgi:integrase